MHIVVGWIESPSPDSADAEVLRSEVVRFLNKPFDFLIGEVQTPHPNLCCVLEVPSVDDARRAMREGGGLKNPEFQLSAWTTGEEVFRSAGAGELGLTQRLAVGDFAYLAQLNVKAESEHGFNEWYNGRHLPDVEGAGLRRSTRYRMHGSPHRYAALYRMDAADTLESEAIAKVRGFDEFTPAVSDLTRTVLQVVVMESVQ